MKYTPTLANGPEARYFAFRKVINSYGMFTFIGELNLIKS